MSEKIRIYRCTMGHYVVIVEHPDAVRPGGSCRFVDTHKRTEIEMQMLPGAQWGYDEQWHCGHPVGRQRGWDDATCSRILKPIHHSKQARVIAAFLIGGLEAVPRAVGRSSYAYRRDD